MSHFSCMFSAFSPQQGLQVGAMPFSSLHFLSVHPVCPHIPTHHLGPDHCFYQVTAQVRSLLNESSSVNTGIKPAPAQNSSVTPTNTLAWTSRYSGTCSSFYPGFLYLSSLPTLHTSIKLDTLPIPRYSTISFLVALVHAISATWSVLPPHRNLSNSCPLYKVKFKHQEEAALPAEPMWYLVPPLGCLSTVCRSLQGLLCAHLSSSGNVNTRSKDHPCPHSVRRDHSIPASSGCCNKITDVMAETTGIYFSQFWRLGNPRTKCW